MNFCRVLPAAALLLLTTTPLAAQQAIGFKLGPSFSTISSSDLDNSERITALTGGGFLRFDLGAFTLQPELMFVRKGVGSTFSEAGFTADVELRLDYVEVPILFLVPLATGARVSPYAYAGPAFAFEVGCTAHVTLNGFSDSGDCDEESNDEMDRRKFDAGAMFGLGVSLPAGPGSFLVEARYNVGLLDLNTSDEGGAARHRSGALLFGYSVPLGLPR